MSRGLGDLQRRIIEVGGATKTVWQCNAPIPVRVCHDEPKTACGIVVQSNGKSTWRVDGKPWYEAHITVSHKDHFDELKANFRHVDFRLPKSKKNELFSSILPACISMAHIRSILWPQLWNPGIVNTPRWDSLGRWMPQVPENIAKGRNAANAGLARAMKSMEKRGLICYLDWISSSDCSSVKDVWKHYFRRKENCFEWHPVYIVLGDLAISKTLVLSK